MNLSPTPRFSRLSLLGWIPIFAMAASAVASALERQTVEADWLRQDAKRLAQPLNRERVSTEADAAGAVDGIKNGQWGFHTEFEDNPWWQVDLGQAKAIERLVVYNRCDGAMADRATRLKVLASSDGRDFRPVHAHRGTVFRGFTDQKPLVIQLDGLAARYLRLTLPGKTYFHLDEVEVYSAGDNHNLALNCPAQQSSTSQWSVNHPRAGTRPTAAFPLALALERGRQLAASLERLGVTTRDALRTLDRVEAAWRGLTPDTREESRRALYFEARWAVREMALANPLLDNKPLLFVKRAPGMFPHMSDQHYGWWSRPGGGLFTLEGYRSSRPQVRCLTPDLPPGNIVGPDVAYDGRKILFAYCRYYPQVANMQKADKPKLPADAFYHVYEINADGSGCRQLTFGHYDDFDPRYLPSGDIAFLSTRKGIALQSTREFSDATRNASLPDSYVRCGGDNFRPVPVFTLHAMDNTGHNLRPLSSFENFEWSPSVANDGRLLYTRWDYIDRFNGHFFSLWSANQDGGNPQLVYGNYTVKPQVVIEARAIPGSSKLVFTASAHHSITGGSLCLLERAKGTEQEEPLTRLTPEVCFPETEGQPEHYYANPWPLSEEFFLVGWADAKLPPHSRVEDQNNPVNAMGLYLYDAFGNLELLYRDPEISSMYPMPLAPRLKPPVQTPLANWTGRQEGRVLVQDVYQGLAGVERGAIQRLRLVAVPPKVQPLMNNPVLGVSAEDPGKYVLGTVPVEPDGSAYFRLPSGIPVFFQALDRQGLAVQTMRTLTYVMPQQTLSCVGCHEHRDTAPPVSPMPLAARREPSKITPGPDGAWPLRFDRLVQPVLERHCVSCHRADSAQLAAAKLDLTRDQSYSTLISFASEDLRKAAFERDRSIAGQGVGANSRLWKLLTQEAGHQGVRLEADSRARLATWLDTYAQLQGSFSEAQEKQLAEFRASLHDLLAAPTESR